MPRLPAFLFDMEGPAGRAVLVTVALFAATAGDDLIDGGAGLDTAVFGGARSGYVITTSGRTTTVTGADGSDRLLDVERLQFGDQLVVLSTTAFSPVADGDAPAPLPGAIDMAPLPAVDLVV